jgi:hypothetical protein
VPGSAVDISNALLWSSGIFEAKATSDTDRRARL